MFDSLSPNRSRPMVLLKRVCQVFVATYLVIGAFATWRSYYQVHSLDLQTDNTVLRPGSMITTNLVSYARNRIDVRLELIQGNHLETLSAHQVLSNEWALLDPRIRRASQTVTLSQDLLNRFEAKPVLMRVTAFGRPQWGRTPPPVVRELTMEIQRN